MTAGQVLCSTERLYDFEQKWDGHVVLGVTLSVSWPDEAGAPPPGSFLTPWHWGEGEAKEIAFQFGVIDLVGHQVAGANRKFFASNEIKVVDVSWGGKKLAELRSDRDTYGRLMVILDSKLARIRKDKSRLGFLPQPTKFKTADTNDYGGSAPWPAILGDLSTRPAPIPQVLRLSYVLRTEKKISDLRGGGKAPYLFAAPILPADVLQPGKAIYLSTEMKTLGLGKTKEPIEAGTTKATLTWNYSDERITAQTELVDLLVGADKDAAKPLPLTTFFDMGNRLVRSNPKSEGWSFDEDWRSSFESRIAEQLDFGGILLKYMEAKKTEIDSGLATSLVDSVVAFLRDIAGLGCQIGPTHPSSDPKVDGLTFLELAKAAKPEDRQKIQDAAENTKFKSVAEWKTFLLNQFNDPKSPLFDTSLAKLMDGVLGQNVGSINLGAAISQLHQLRQKLLKPDILLALLRAQLAVFSSGSPASLSALQLKDPKVLPAALRMENLGRYWKIITKIISDAAPNATVSSTREALAKALQEAFKYRVASAPDYLIAIPNPDKVSVLPLDWTSSNKYILPDPNTSSSAGSENPIGAYSGLAPQGINLQVAEMGLQPTDVNLSEIDWIRKVQGVALLLAYDNSTAMKGSPGREWRCLNYCDVHFLDGDDLKLLESGVLVPNRFTFQNGLAVATISYNNEPLSAAGPLSEIAAVVHTTKTTVGADLFKYSYPRYPNPTKKNVRLLPLAYGVDYRAQPFLVSNAGIAPEFLTQTTGTGSCIELKGNLDVPTEVLSRTHWPKIPYRRQSGVGSLRLSNHFQVGESDPEKSRRQLDFPTIPDGVFPRTPSDAAGDGTPLKDQPLVLLIPSDPKRFRSGTSVFRFAVRPPSVDILTWDRSVNTPSNPLSTKRPDVLAAFFQQKNTQISNVPSQNAYDVYGKSVGDLTVDDPATVAYSAIGGIGEYDCRLYVELIPDQTDPSSNLLVVGTLVTFPPPAVNSAGLEMVQSVPVLFEVSAGGSRTVPELEPSNGALVAPNRMMNVNVPEGQIVTLKLSVCVPVASKNQFSAAAWRRMSNPHGGNEKDPPMDPSNKYYLVSPTEMKIEVATDTLPDPQSIFAAFDFESPQFDVENGTAAVKLNMQMLDSQRASSSKTMAVPLSRYVYSAEVLRQVWKWQGRPVHPPLPPSLQLPSDTNEQKEAYKRWMMREFGTRTDFLRTAMTPQADESAQLKSFRFVEDLSFLLSASQQAATGSNPTPTTTGTAKPGSQGNPAPARKSVPSDQQLRGTFIRYGVQIESRYKGVINGPGYQRGETETPELWRDLYVPSRKMSPLQPPNVKLVLPLTRNPDAAQNEGPGILVLLRGSWFQECGLGEGLQAKVTVIGAPENPDKDPKDKKVFYYQYGPDPILANVKGRDGVAQDTNEPPDPNKPPLVPDHILGPVGHTFDTVPDDQLFVNTSFVLKYPNSKEIHWEPWAFCQLQFRKVLNVLGPKGETVERANSDWTQPIWVQLLPDFDLYYASAAPHDPKRIDKLRFKVQNGQSIQLLDQGESPIGDLPGGSGDPSFADFLVLTQYVSDATGVPIQEAYVAICRQSGGVWNQFDPKGVQLDPNNTDYRARILTVQGRPNALLQLSDVNEESDFWDRIFTAENNDGSPPLPRFDRDRLRIVAVSRPIEMLNSKRNGGC